MAKGYLTLEITAQRLQYVYLEGDSRQCKVLSFGEVAHVINVAATGELTQAIQAIMARESITPRRLFVTMCGQENFIRQFIIPKMSMRDQDESIKSEIEKFPAFTQYPFEYISRVSDEADDKSNVVFAATQTPLIKYIFEECKNLGLPFEHLEIAPLNLKHLLPLLNPELLKPGESQALLVVNDQVSYLLVTSGGQYRLIYQAGIGLELLYPDHKGAVNDKTLHSFVGEGQRAFKSYLFKNRTEKISKLLLVWDRTKGPDLDKVLKGRLDVEVEALSLDKMPLFKIEAQEPASNPLHTLMVVPLVLYLRRIKAQFPMDHFCKRLNVIHYIRKFILTAALVVILGGSVLLYNAAQFYQKTIVVKENIVAVEGEFLALNNANLDLQKERDEYVRLREGLLLQANLVKSLNRVSWSEVLSLVAEEMPKKMRLTSFKFSESGQVSFMGQSLEIETIAELIRRVDRSVILENGKFDFLTENTVDEQKVFNFGILANLKSNAAEPKEVTP